MHWRAGFPVSRRQAGRVYLAKYVNAQMLVLYDVLVGALHCSVFGAYGEKEAVLDGECRQIGLSHAPAVRAFPSQRNTL